ncbi:MAG: PqqD family protein [Abditibacteriota bacterium]|nr:PqqD family protein [Abditibacteriota bacterium]
MRIKDGYMLKKVAGENLLINTGPASADFSKVIKLNDTAAWMWQQIADGNSPEETAQLAAEKYSIDIEKARQDVGGFAAELVKNGLAEP